MKRDLELTLLRHGIAMDREHWGERPDLERPLTAKGLKRVRRGAKGLAGLGLQPELVLTSPAVRARQTAEGCARALGISMPQLMDEPALAPGASAEALLARLEQLQARKVLCVGHAPHLDELLTALLGLRRAEPALALKKGGAAVVSLRSPRPGQATLRALLAPAVLRKLGRG